MATTTTVTGSANAQGTRLRMRIDRTAVNHTANTSTVRVRVWVVVSSYWFEQYTSSHTCKIDGATVLNNVQIQRTCYPNSEALVMDNSRVVSHNAAGAKTVSSSASFSNAITGTASVSASLALDTIPRATTPSVSGSFTTGSAKTISLPRASSAFTHDVTYKVGSTTGTIQNGAGTSTSWTPPHSLFSEYPSSTSGTVEITVVTKNGSSTIGTKTVGFPLSAGSGLVPSVSGVTWSDDNSTVRNNIGVLLQNMSLVKGSVSASGTAGSWITERKVRLGSTEFAENTPFKVSSSGTVTASGYAKDSRGRTATKSANFNVVAYQTPRITSGGWNVRRANSSNVASETGTYLRVDLHAAATSLVVGGTQKNALTVKVRTRPKGGAWTNRNTINPGLSHSGPFQVSGGAAYPTTTSFEVEITLSDKAGGTAKLVTTVASAVVTLDLNGDKVGVGKMHEYGALDVAGDVYGEIFFSYGRQLGGFREPSWREHSDLPSTYPLGISVSGTSGTDWPATWGTLLTNKMLNHNRGYQILVAQNAASIHIRYMNTASGANSWSSWSRIVMDNHTATTSLSGLARIATQAEVNAGTISAHAFVTPATLRNSSRIPAATAAGALTVPSSGTTTVTFPSGRFNVAPRFTALNRGTSNVAVVHASNPTSTSVDVRVFTISGAQITGYVDWQAIQMSASAASG